MKEKKFDIFTKFIPTTDVDGVDIKSEYLSYITDMKIRNGFVESTPKFIQQDLPPGVKALTEVGYYIEAITYFYHSQQGHTSVVILWNENANEVDRVKVLVNDEVMDTPSYANGTLRYLTEPKNVNFHLINDELKININCKGRIGEPGTSEPEFVVNLNLAWLEEVKYTSGEAISGIKPAGWYLSLRWLGKEYSNKESLIPQAFFGNSHTLYEKQIWEDFQEPINPNIIFDPNSFIIYPPGWYYINGELVFRRGGIKLVNNTSEDIIRKIKWIKLNNVGSMTISFGFEGQANSPDAHHHIAIDVARSSGITGVTRIAEFSVRDFPSYTSHTQHIDLNEFNVNEQFELLIYLVVPRPLNQPNNTTTVYIEGIILYPEETILIGKYFNSQRALLLHSKDHALIPYSFDVSAFKFNVHKQLDYRISEYEIYVKSSVDNLYYKKLIYKVDSEWGESSDYYYNTSPEVIKEPEETLNFNYGLGEIYVDKDFEIYSETVLTGRVYAATNSYIMRISHLSGSGKIQPDSFPYDLDKKVGYIEDLKSSTVKALISLNENNLALISDSGIAIFSSFANRGINVKQLRIAVNLFSKFNTKSLTKSLVGNSPTAGLYFTSKEGMWYHDGSYNSLPQNLTFQDFFNYWQNAKKDGIGFFVKELDEYWYEYDDVEFLVFEASYKSFRKVTKPAPNIKGMFEYPDGSIGIYSSNSIYSWGLKNAEYGTSTFATHRNTLESEFYNKILQSIEVKLKKEVYESIPTFSYFVYVYADSKVYSFKFSSAEQRQIRLFPLSVRCKEVILIVAFPASIYKNAVSEVILRYTVDGTMADVHSTKEYLTVTLPSGYGRDYGKNYIVI